MYKVLGGDGKEYGPISAENVRQWIAEGRLGAQSQILAEGSSEWKPLSEFPELSSALGTRATPPIPPGSTAALATGAAKTSGLAITSVILGAFGCFGVTAIAGLICGIVALTAISKSRGQQRGKGLAITGICLSGVTMMLMALLVLPAMLIPALAKAKGKAQEIHCINNMKQIGLALRIYSSDNNGILPRDFLSMSNELGSPLILVCPADPQRTGFSPFGWTGLTTNNFTYLFLTPGAAESNVVNQVVVVCPIHGSVCMGDGSVQRGNFKSSPR